MGSQRKALVVGAGMTGSFTACQLREKFSDTIRVSIWEKSRGAGGRMATNRYARKDSLACDYGAQYISATPEFQKKHARYYNEMLSAGIFKFFEGNIIGESKFDPPGNKQYVAPNGINSIAKYYLKRSGSEVNYGRLCETVNFSDDNSKWNVLSDDQSFSEVVDALILTMPVPQILKLGGDILKLLEPHRSNLEKVQYSSRYSLLMYFDQWNVTDIPWTCNYVQGDDCVIFISLDAQKRQQDPRNGMSVVVHTSVPFGIKHLEDDMTTVEPIIRESVRKIIPSLPEPSFTKCHRWRYSQVSRAFTGSPGSLVIHENPLLILGGDGFLHSNFDGCIDSGLSILNCFQ